MTGLIMVGPHIVVGVVVLALFWRTILSRKGSASHRRWGRLYLLLLPPLLASVVPITLEAVVQDGPARVVQLVYLALVVAAGGWTAWRAIKDRRDVERFRGPVFRGLALSMLVGGLSLLAIGILKSNVLTVGFSSIGIVYGGAMLGFLGRPPAADWWLSWHLNGIALLFAATHASFVGLVARRALPELAGEPMQALTQLGTIALAFCLRQWLGWRYSGLAGRPAAPQLSMGRRPALGDSP